MSCDTSCFVVNWPGVAPLRFLDDVKQPVPVDNLRFFDELLRHKQTIHPPVLGSVANLVLQWAGMRIGRNFAGWRRINVAHHRHKLVVPEIYFPLKIGARLTERLKFAIPYSLIQRICRR